MITAAQLTRQRSVQDTMNKLVLSIFERGGNVKQRGIIIGDGSSEDMLKKLGSNSAQCKKRFLDSLVVKIKKAGQIEHEFLTRTDIRNRYALNKNGLRNMRYYDALPAPIVMNGRAGWAAGTVLEMEKRLINGEMK